MFRRKTSDGFDAGEVPQQAGGGAAAAAAQTPLLLRAGQQARQPSATSAATSNSGRQRVDGTPATAAAAAARTPAVLPTRVAGPSSSSSVPAVGGTAAATADAPQFEGPQPQQQEQQQLSSGKDPVEPLAAFKTYGNALFAGAANSGAAESAGGHSMQSVEQSPFQPPSRQRLQQQPPTQQQQQQQSQAREVAARTASKPLPQLKAGGKDAQLLAAAAVHAEATDSRTPSGDAASAGDVDGMASFQRGPRYRFNPDTGQLVLDGSGQGGGAVVRRFEEDWRTGGFYPAMAPGEGGGLLGWYRRWRAERPPEWEDVGIGAGLLRNAWEFSDSVGHWCGVFGTFVQGLCGGLAVLVFFQTYVLSASEGPAAFLGFYSPIAQQINRAFYALISFSLITAASRAAFDQVAGLGPPRGLRVRVVDGGALALFAIAYVCNLVATPLDDQLSYEYARAPGYWELQPLPRTFRERLAGWHALNVARAAACCGAWALASYRASPRVMAEAAGALAAAGARRQHSGAGRQGAGGGGGGGLGGSGVAGLPSVAVG